MPRLPLDKNPSYRRHKASRQAVVTIAGKDVYFGRYDSADSRAAYDRVIAEWRAGGRQPHVPSKAAPGLTVGELILRYWPHVEQHYRHPDGRPTSEVEGYRNSLRPLRQLYEALPAVEFGPLALKAVRQRLVELGLSRGVVNQRVGRIKRMFKWAAGEELVPVAVYQALATVAGLARGSSPARETDPVKPVPDAAVAATLPHLSPPLAAMVQLQLLTGMRPGEVGTMRPCDLDMTGDVWLYRPALHKTAWRGKARVIPLGPQAQAVVRDLLPLRTDEYLFSPARGRAAWLAEVRGRRRTSAYPYEVKRRRAAAPKRRPGAKYSTVTYGQAIAKACARTSVARWHPNQLRHTFATLARRQVGLEAAQVVLGHSRADVTQVYAERDLALAERVAAAVG
jgi:integrase